jgi:hypothetical protein
LRIPTGGFSMRNAWAMAVVGLLVVSSACKETGRDAQQQNDPVKTEQKRA